MIPNIHVYRLNSDVDDKNEFMLHSIASEDQQYIINACDAISGQTCHVDLSNISEKRSDTGGLLAVLKLAIGARVMLTANVDVSDGLVNGARGEVVHVITTTDNKVSKVLIKFDNPHVRLHAIQSSQYYSVYNDAVPLSKHEAIFLAQGRRGSEVTHLQFSLTLAWATTIHKVRGLTLDEIVVDIKGGHFSPGQVYVAFSRVKTLQGLHILNFNTSAIKKSDKVHEEMCRLNTKQLATVPQLQCHSLSVTLALLNIRSIRAKLPDILHDESLSCANILCFCETWLSPLDSFPPIHDNHVTLRCDRAFDNHKGGVLISVVDDVFNRSDSRILNLMSTNGFKQLVSTPTTDRGTLIDHIYYNRSSDDIIIEVCDTYYSDHDTVYCSIPL